MSAQGIGIDRVANLGRKAEKRRLSLVAGSAVKILISPQRLQICFFTLLHRICFDVRQTTYSRVVSGVVVRALHFCGMLRAVKDWAEKGAVWLSARELELQEERRTREPTRTLLE
jgi:hypothetical protein